MAEPKRRWRFYVEDFDEEGQYVGANGEAVGYDEEDTEFIGTFNEAEEEADRRADLWELANDRLAAKVVHESMGKEEV